jgi:flagellar motor switch/type III secretory pathway protein FliN
MAAAIAFPAAKQEELSGSGWERIQEAPCTLVAEIPVQGFTVRDLLLLQAGYLVNSKQSTSAKIAVRASGSFLAWAQFEAVNGRLGVRLTDLG